MGQGCALPTELFLRYFVTWHLSTLRFATNIQNFKESGKRGSNSRPQPWQGCALPTELFPRLSPCQGWHLIILGQGCALPTELFPHNFNLLLSFAHPCQGWHLILLGQGCALPTELFPRYFVTRHFRRRSLCESELSHSLARKFRITMLFTNTKSNY